jgi:AraC-like DNA-binding protein
MTAKTAMTDDIGPGAGPNGRGLADEPLEMRGPAVVRHEEFRTVDPDAARRFFASAYSPGWEITGLARGTAVTHRRSASGLVTIDELLIEGRARCEIQTTDSVIVIQPREGSLTIGGEHIPTVDTPVIATHDMPCVLRTNTARLTVVTFDANLLRRVAAERNAPAPQQIRFESSRPRSSAVVRTWRRTLDYVIASFGSAETAEEPLVVGAEAQLLAAAMLECFQSNVNAGVDLLGNPEVPQTFKGAVSFIERHAGDGIGINDVAAAVRLTPRAVQYLFRQQLDTTPTQYLRRVRLHRAHLDLLGGNRSTTTVSEIAQRWGFAHTGRFAVLYREAYGQSPHTTLQQ